MIDIIDLNFLENSQTIASFLIKTEEGPILVETGPHSVLPRLEKGLNNLGYKLEEIQHVFLTHIHLDHAGAAWYFAQQGASIYLHPAGKKHLAAPERLMESARRIYGNEMDRLWGQMNPIPEEQLRVVEDGEQIRVGDTSLKALHSPGHAIHHIAWQLGDSIFTGDVAGVKIGKLPVVPPCPPPDIEIEAWKGSIQRLKSIGAKRFYLTHFGEITTTEDHLNDLEAILQDWSQWMLKAWKSGKSPEEITPEFQAYTAKQLKAAGAGREALAQYEAANPSWMSVAGLIRYWKKKEENAANK